MLSGRMDTVTMLARLREIAYEGLQFARDPYDRGRYEALSELVRQAYASGLPADLSLEPAGLDASFAAELGVLTPKVGVDGLILDDDGRVLLHRRSDDSRWSLPGGWLGSTETPRDGVAREVREETGLVVDVGPMVLVWTRPAAAPASPFASVHFTYVCVPVAGELTLSHESTALEFFDPAVVTDWHRDHRERVERALSSRGEVPENHAEAV